MSHGQSKPKGPLCRHMLPCTCSKGCKHAIGHVCANSIAGWASAEIHTSLAVPDPDLEPVGERTCALGNMRGVRGCIGGDTLGQKTADQSED